MSTKEENTRSPVAVAEMWLDTLEVERRALKMRLLQIEKVLVQCGRLKRRSTQKDNE